MWVLQKEINSFWQVGMQSTWELFSDLFFFIWNLREAQSLQKGKSINNIAM